MGLRKGSDVHWSWGRGMARGKIVERYNRRVALDLAGTEVVRNADAGNPAFRIVQEDGSEVLKSGSELTRAT